jgi:hypothetical protein
MGGSIFSKFLPFFDFRQAAVFPRLARNALSAWGGVAPLPPPSVFLTHCYPSRCGSQRPDYSLA